MKGVNFAFTTDGTTGNYVLTALLLLVRISAIHYRASSHFRDEVGEFW